MSKTLGISGPTTSHGRLGWLLLFGVLLVTAVAFSSSDAIAQDGGTLAAGDRIRVTVFGEDDLSGEFEIDASGEISMPLIGKVRAAGTGVRSLEASIVVKLLDGYLKNPRISVEVLSFRSIFVLGEVNHPGNYPYATGLTVLKAVALAGGFTYRAKENGVLVTRGIDPDKGEQKTVGNTSIMPGDIIRVPERFF